MIEKEPRPRWLLVLLCALAVATVLGWSSVAFVYFGMNAFGRTYPLGRAVLAGLVDWYFWAAVTPLVFWLGQRFRLERSPWVGAAAMHLTAGIAVALLEILTVTAFGRSVGMTSTHGSFFDAYIRMILQYFHFNFIIYWVIVAAAHAARYYASYRERALEASRLRAELTQAQLMALQMQLQPHFLFNTLHTVATLVREGRTEDATDTIAGLGELLRRTLGDSDRHETALADEIGFVQGYLDIEQMRFSDRLAVTYDIPADAMHAMIPRMALQPLAENAIRHGIARDPGARRVAIRAQRAGEQLRLEVENEGPPWDGGGNGSASGVGLANVRARLSRLYGTACRLEMQPGGTGGTLAIMEIPWRSGS
jgi:two-component system LytT family sensor kinase